MKGLFFTLIFLVASCNPTEEKLAKACPAAGWSDNLITTVKLNSSLGSYKIMVDGIEVGSDCLLSKPCLKEQKIENNLLKLTLSYPMDELPNKIDFTLIEQANPDITRIEAFDVLLAYPSPGSEVEQEACDGPKEAMISLEE